MVEDTASEISFAFGSNGFGSNLGSISDETPVLVIADWRTIPASNALVVRVGPASSKMASKEWLLAHSRNPSNGACVKGTKVAFGFVG